MCCKIGGWLGVLKSVADRIWKINTLNAMTGDLADVL